MNCNSVAELAAPRTDVVKPDRSRLAYACQPLVSPDKMNFELAEAREAADLLASRSHDSGTGHGPLGSFALDSSLG